MHKKEDSFIFNLRDFDYSKDVCNRVSIVKVYHLYERRNEWLNWNGDTGLVRRGGLVRPTLEESTDRAEKLRLQGTRFFIEEIPAVCFHSNRKALIATELFDSAPRVTFRAGATFSFPITLKDIDDQILPLEWLQVALYIGDQNQLVPYTVGDIFYKRESRSTGGKSCLGWSLKPNRIEVKNLQSCIQDVGIM